MKPYNFTFIILYNMKNNNKDATFSTHCIFPELQNVWQY